MVYHFTGLLSEIPAGLQLADGTNGTPNLTDKMIIGASVDSGGQAKTTIEGSPTKSGGAATKTLSIAEIPSHTHTIPSRTSSSSGTVQRAIDADNNSTQLDTITSSTSGGDTAFSLLNPYYALAFIMRPLA